MKIRLIVLIISALIFLPISLKAQHKYEREYRMKAALVPETALAFIDEIGVDSRIKWFKEIGFADVAIEAKFKHNDRKFSVKFDTLGTLHDVEFIIGKSEIDPLAYSRIEQSLDSLYEKWSFRKIQKRYTGLSSDIIAKKNYDTLGSRVGGEYEIVLKGKAGRFVRLYEFLFDERGEILSTLQIIREKADHLEY